MSTLEKQADKQTKHYANVRTDFACNYFAEVKALLYFGGMSGMLVFLHFVGWIQTLAGGECACHGLWGMQLHVA